MFDQLSCDTIQLIARYVSIELVIYIFPMNRITYLDFQRYNYSWALCFSDRRLRARILLWFIRQGYLPLNISYTFDRLSSIGNLYIIQRLRQLVSQNNISIERCHSARSMDWACASGHIHIINWWHEQLSTNIKYTVTSIDYASIYGHVDILNWWKQRSKEGFDLLYTRDAIDRTQSVDVLNWWLHMNHKYDLDLRYSTRSIDRTTDLNILNWWLNAHLLYGVRLKYKKHSINRASASGNLDILNWWIRSSSQHHSIYLKYDESAIDSASQNGHIDVLNWWLTQHLHHGFAFKYTHSAIDTASQNGHVHVLDWWFTQYQKGHCNLKRSIIAVNAASRNGHTHVLDWWLDVYLRYRIPMLYDLSALESALEQPCSLNWWLNARNQHRFVFQHIHWNHHYFYIE